MVEYMDILEWKKMQISKKSAKNKVATSANIWTPTLHFSLMVGFFEGLTI